MTQLCNLSFSIDEYRTRVNKVQAEISKLPIDGLLCHDVASTCYLTGFQSIMGAGKYSMTLILPEGDPVLIAQDFEMHNASISCWLEDKDKVRYGIFEDPIEVTKRLLVERGLAGKNIGLEMGRLCLGAAEFETLKQALPKTEFSNATPVVANIRAVKSPAEIDFIRRAAVISSGAMKVLLELAAEGRTDNDLAAAAMEFCTRQGSEFFCIEPIISLGARSGVPHCTFTRNRIERGNLCFVEIGACIHRYSGPLIRTFSIGEPGALEKRIGDEVQASLNAVIDNLRPGISTREVALKARKPWEWTYTNKELFWNGAYAYSTGLGFPPDWGDAQLLIREEDETVLRPGMVFHCTNNVRKAGIFGVGMSETVAITDTGCEVLTNFPRHLFIL